MELLMANGSLGLNDKTESRFWRFDSFGSTGLANRQAQRNIPAAEGSQLWI